MIFTNLKIYYRSIFAAFTLCAVIKEGASMLFPQGRVSVCFGEPITFICNVSKHSSLPRLEWRIDFQDVVSVPSITEQFTGVDREGQISEEDKTGINFQFNLTSNNEQSLVSSMTITVHDVNGTGVINNATATCGSGGEHNPQATINVGGSPVSTMNINWSVDATLQQEADFNQTVIDVQWSTVALAAHYVIDINPAVPSGSTFITTGNTYHLSILTNQEYNISVMATNCAGNGTLAEMIIRNNNYSTSMMNPVVTSSGSGEFKQGNSTSMQFLIYIIPSISVAVIICTIIVISSVSIKVYTRLHSHKTRPQPDGFNVYSETPVLNQLQDNIITTEDQESQIGIYSLLQSEEKSDITALPATPSSSPQGLGLIYADINCKAPSSINGNISLQLGDDRVQYAEVKLHTDHGDSGGFCTTLSVDDTPPPIPPKLTNLDEEMWSDTDFLSHQQT